MINITEKNQCCGCNACGDACCHEAISFKTDSEGFWYPYVNTELCVDCGICDNVCPMHKKNTVPQDSYESPLCFGAYNKNHVTRHESTSGGLFSALADYMYKQGGYVSGAIYTEHFDVVNIVSNNINDLKRIRGSKYIQSSAIGLYKEIKSLLKDNKKVLVCGTPCQMSALRSFLKDIPNNLLIVDILCKSCNSPKVFHKYIQSLEDRFNSPVVTVKERDKDHGWNSLTRKVSFENGSVFFGKGYSDHFQRGFQYNVFARPSCYDCQFKSIPRIGDITLGDFWGVEELDINLYDNKGTSMVFLNNEKGRKYFEAIKDQLIWKEVVFKDILIGNKTAILKNHLASPHNINRKNFFEDLNSMPFDKLAIKHFPPPQCNYLACLKSIIKRTLSSIRIYL